MTVFSPPTDAPAPAQRHRQQPLSAAHHAMEAPPNAGFAGHEGGGMMEIETAAVDAAFASFGVSPATPVPTSRSPAFVAGTPDSSATASSYGADSSDNDDEDAMVDAAMYESGLLTTALLSEDHIGLDSMLLHEMDELLAKEGSTHWDQYHLESPSLQFPTPGAPWTMSHSGGFAVPGHHEVLNAAGLHSSQSMFIPSGAGWAVPGAEPTHHERTDVSDDAEMEQAESDPEPPEANMKEMELLARQIKFLEAQRDFLDYKATLAATSETALDATAIMDRRDAILEKRRLLEAQLHREMLMKVAKQQLENLKYAELLLLQTPLTHYRMTLMTPMESYIHLTRDPAERRITLMSLRDEKLEMTKQFIDFQSRNIDVERQFFYLDTFEKFGKFYTVDFSISKFDEASVDDVVNVIYNHFVSSKDTISQVLGSVENREYFDGVEWTFLNARFVDRINLPKRRGHDRGFVVQESNTVYYMKKIGGTVLMTCDFIDKDDLHPYRPTGRIRKDKNVGVIIEPYVDSTGKKSVVMKRFSFIKHHFKNIEPTPELIQAISTKVILWGQAVKFCLSSRKPNSTSPVQIKPEFLSRAAKITELAGSVTSQ